LEANPLGCKVLVQSISEQEAPPQIHLAIACLQNGEEEDIAFHATQMPLAAIHLLRTERSLEPRAASLAKLLRRMEAKSLAALKQNRKAWLTEIKAPAYLNEVLEHFKGNVVACDKDGYENFQPSQKTTAILTGPEGGFSPHELELMKNKNAFFLSLGTTRLRAVSAPIFALGRISIFI
jgi:16S rRNA (uracil1498-N3)-methyltransferase